MPVSRPVYARAYPRRRASYLNSCNRMMSPHDSVCIRAGYGAFSWVHPSAPVADVDGQAAAGTAFDHSGALAVESKELARESNFPCGRGIAEQPFGRCEQASARSVGYPAHSLKGDPEGEPKGDGSRRYGRGTPPKPSGATCLSSVKTGYRWIPRQSMRALTHFALAFPAMLAPTNPMRHNI